MFSSRSFMVLGLKSSINVQLLFGSGISSVQFSCLVMSDSLRPHEPREPYEQPHARAPCPSPTPRVTQTHVH